MSSHDSTSSRASPKLSVPRYDQSPHRSLFSDDEDYSELLTLVSSSPSSGEDGYSPHFGNTPPDFRTVEGSERLFSAQNTLYMLPLDEQEFKRLDKQHTLHRIALLGLYPARELVDSILKPDGADQNPKAILDIGCGTGQWAREMAKEFQHVSVHGIDIADPFIKDPPANLFFERHDVNDGLEPYYGRFDLVHCRWIASGIIRYRDMVDDVRRCLRPGGIAIFIEGDFDLFKEDQITIQEPASDANPDGSWLQRWLQAVRMAQVKRCKIDGSDESPEMLDLGLWGFEGFDRNTCRAASVFTPTTPWIQSNQQAEALHFKIAGVLMRQNLKMFILSTEQILLEDGLDREEVDKWMINIRNEIEGDGKFNTWCRWRIAWGCAPRGNVPATPVASPPAAPAINGIIKPSWILGSRSRLERRKLIEMVEHFKIRQLHVYNQKQAADSVERRMNTPFNTRGLF